MSNITLGELAAVDLGMTEDVLKEAKYYECKDAKHAKQMMGVLVDRALQDLGIIVSVGMHEKMISMQLEKKDVKIESRNYEDHVTCARCGSDVIQHHIFHEVPDFKKCGSCGFEGPLSQFENMAWRTGVYIYRGDDLCFFISSPRRTMMKGKNEFFGREMFFIQSNVKVKH